tara:strand:- start:2046 stop:2717 length:672 start_codon:yes stop_codon:yes gene_type:complete
MNTTVYGLQTCYDRNNTFEIGVDEAGRGPLFGPVYTAAVVLPKDNQFNHDLMRDSKKITSKKKIKNIAEYIKTNAIAWSIQSEDENMIDKINIRQCVLSSMHKSIKDCIQQLNTHSVQLLIDGNDFKPYTYIDNDQIEYCSHVTIKGGDNLYTSIAAASILAKVARDEYILKLCEQNPYLEDHYGIASNKGYGAKRHMDGIKEHGITKWHRNTYGICKNYVKD